MNLIKNNTFLPKSAKVILLSAAMAVATASSQAGVITWDYDIVGAFTGSSFTGVGATTSATSLAWGTSTGTGQSSLVIDNTNASGQVDTYYGAGTPPAAFTGTSIDLTHNNNPITDNFLTGATIQTTITLDPAVPNNAALPAQAFNFDILFSETPNSGPCADATSPIPCNDIFILSGGLPNFNFFYDALDGDGELEYFVNVFITDNNALGVLDDNICTAAGAASGCIGLTTIEEQSNLIPFGFTISTERLTTVPEPTSIALFGLGMMLLSVRSFKA